MFTSRRPRASQAGSGAAIHPRLNSSTLGARPGAILARGERASPCLWHASRLARIGEWFRANERFRPIRDIARGSILARPGL
jgi:hypothetical protein